MLLLCKMFIGVQMHDQKVAPLIIEVSLLLSCCSSVFNNVIPHVCTKQLLKL